MKHESIAENAFEWTPERRTNIGAFVCQGSVDHRHLLLDVDVVGGELAEFAQVGFGFFALALLCEPSRRLQEEWQADQKHAALNSVVR